MDTRGRLAVTTLESETKTKELARLNEKIASYKQKCKDFKQAMNEDA
jgi:hypothetical protein